MRPLNSLIELQLQTKQSRDRLEIQEWGFVTRIRNPIADGAPLRKVADLAEESP